MIEVPLVTKLTTGLAYKAGKWSATYRQDGVRKWSTLGTASLAEAIIRRDAFYAKLRAAGATVSKGRGGSRCRDAEFVYHNRESWTVSVRGVRVGTYYDRDEAERARKAFLALVPGSDMQRGKTDEHDTLPAPPLVTGADGGCGESAPIENGAVIEIPRHTKAKPTIARKGRKWYAFYFVDGFRKWVSLGIGTRHEAIRRRDALYADLVANGATERKSRQRTVPPINADPVANGTTERGKTDGHGIVTEIPRHTKSTTGLVRMREKWYAFYFVDGVCKWVSLGTIRASAIRRRDALYADLVANGATVRWCPNPSRRELCDIMDNGAAARTREPRKAMGAGDPASAPILAPTDSSKDFQTAPISPPSGPATGFFNGLHVKSKFQAFIHSLGRLKIWKHEEKRQARADLDKATTLGPCFDCGTIGECHSHHVVPRVLGGAKTVQLCESCHGRVHGRGMVNHNHLIRQGLESARRNGKKLGRPYGTVIPTAEFLEKHTDIVRRLKCGDSIRTTAAVTKRSKGLVEKVRRVLKGESPPLLPPPPPPPPGDAG